MSSQNYLKQTLIGTALVIATLLALSLVPEFDVGSFHFKKINILADILVKPRAVEETVPDTVAVVKPLYADTCKQGVVCVEDFTPDTSGLDLFFAALEKAQSRPVRIAWFGDSYVEGDILLQPLRDTLQALFGGSGVGFVPVTSEVAGFRQTITHTYKGWTTYEIVGKHEKEIPLGPAGYTGIPLEGNYVSYKAVKYAHLNRLPSIKFFYGQSLNSSIKYYLNDSAYTQVLENGEGLHKLSIAQAVNSFKVEAQPSDRLAVYGASFESATGVILDNFSMRGNSGIGLSLVGEKMLHDFDSMHHYDLVILSYGLNVANEKSKTYDWYVRSMNPTIAMVRKAFPNSAILIVGCSDRADKIDGEMKSMPSVKRLVNEQRKMAAGNGVCFWDLRQAMGGDSTMIRWADIPKRPLANKDYTHLTFQGGKKVADIFLNTLLYEREKYERKKKSR